MDKILTVVGIVYLIAANSFAVYLTVYDKIAARKNRRRVPENTLLLTAALSGCIGMYLTMRIIHHKTKHPKFMIGIPVIFFLELLAVIALAIALTPKL